MGTDNPVPDYVTRNRAHWDESASQWSELGRRAWAGEPSWGIWGVPDATDLYHRAADTDTLEIGCGTAYISAWLARAGARPVGLDNSWRQLEIAAALQEDFGLPFPLIHGIGERLPLADQSFDFVVSEYGSAIWSDPYVWIPESARVLRPGGELIFLANSALFALTVPDYIGNPATNELLRPQFGMHRFEWPDDDSVEFHLGHGDMLRLLRATGFEILDLIEIQAPDGPDETRFEASREWARQWPSEEIWRVRKLA